MLLSLYQIDPRMMLKNFVEWGEPSGGLGGGGGVNRKTGGGDGGLSPAGPRLGIIAPWAN